MSLPPPADRHYSQRLKVAPDASRAEIVRAYRRLALGAHPDMHPGDAEATRRFREATEAYEVLAGPRRCSGDDHRSAAPAGPRRVAVRRAPDPGATGGRPTALGPAIMFVLGPRTRPTRGLALRAGPVRVEPGGR